MLMSYRKDMKAQKPTVCPKGMKKLKELDPDFYVWLVNWLKENEYEVIE